MDHAPVFPGFPGIRSSFDTGMEISLYEGTVDPGWNLRALTTLLPADNLYLTTEHIFYDDNIGKEVTA